MQNAKCEMRIANCQLRIEEKQNMGNPDTPANKKSWILEIVPGEPADAVPAWEQVEPGRYMPRRIRGSYRGRELG
jgi:hypothetical protein